MKAFQADSYLLVSGENIYKSERTGDGTRKEYGVLAAQFQNGLHVCAAGCTGSAGLGIVQAAREMIFSPQERDSTRVSDPVWAIVEVDVRPTRNAADPREVVDQRIVYGPVAWEA